MALIKYNILDYILQQTGARPQKQGDKVLLNPCPVCGHKDHFFVYPQNNSYYSFSGCCKGGTIIDWLIEHDGISLADAMKQVNGHEPPKNRQRDDELKKLASLLNQKVEGFFNACVDKYKLMKYAENEFRTNGIDYTDPYYRWIRQGLRFYDRATTEFINGDFEKRVQLMRDCTDEYFFKLCPEVVAVE